MMMSGKSTIGRKIAERLDCRFIDLDEAIERETGRSISEWFEFGEPAFRQIESETLQKVLTDDCFCVIATGGGVVLDEGNRRLCRSRGFVVYLDVTLDELASRVSGPSGRPLMDGAHTPRDVLARLLEHRRDLYRETQHVTLPAGQSGVDELVEATIRAYDARAED